MKHSQYSRRFVMITGTASALMLPTSSADTNPLFLGGGIGFFRRIIPELVEEAVKYIIGGTIGAALTAPIIDKRTRDRTKIAIEKMRRSPQGPFTEIVAGTAGGVAGTLVKDYLTDAKTTDKIELPTKIAISHRRTKDKSADCMALTSNIDSDRHTTMWETPEILALSIGVEKVRQKFSPKFASRILYPLYAVDDGHFTYEEGHSHPSVHKTTEGHVKIFSKVIDENEARTGIEFIPDSRSLIEKFSLVEILRS